MSCMRDSAPVYVAPADLLETTFSTVSIYFHVSALFSEAIVSPTDTFATHHTVRSGWTLPVLTYARLFSLPACTAVCMRRRS